MPSTAIIELMKTLERDIEKSLKNEIHKLCLHMIKVSRVLNEQEKPELR